MPHPTQIDNGSLKRLATLAEEHGIESRSILSLLESTLLKEGVDKGLLNILAQKMCATVENKLGMTNPEFATPPQPVAPPRPRPRLVA